MPESDSDYMTNYLKRISDLENPLPQDSKLFLPPRPDNPAPAYMGDGITKLKQLTTEEKNKLREEYLKCIEETATVTLSNFTSDTVTTVLDGKGWIIPELISPAECEEVVQAGEAWGIKEEENSKVAPEMRIRTSNRTNSYCNEELTVMINPRLPKQFLQLVENSAPFTSVRGIHPNWRVARYREGETFPAHQDQADSVIVKHEERARQRYTSSHTLLINLRRPGEDFQGGATRFFMDGTYTGKTVDVILPQGWALVFQQRGLFHAGMPLKGDGVKYIVQAGLLRGEPAPGVVTGPASIFKYAPGIKNY